MRCGVFEGKLVDPLDSGFDEAENLLPAIAGGGGGLEDDGFAGAEFLHGFGEEADVFFDELGFDLVGFGEDEGEGEFVLDKPLDELEIEFCGVWRESMRTKVPQRFSRSTRYSETNSLNW